MINKTEAVLRIALGSDSLRAYIKNKDETLLDDFVIIEKMSFLGMQSFERIPN